VNNLAAFTARYGAPPPGVQIAGEWQAGDNLSDGGEEVKLSYGAGTPIRAFAYDDAPLWPADADLGYALVLINPASVPDHTVATNWRSSVQLQGRPGLSDARSFAAWATSNGVSIPNMDEDNDGLSNLAEYVLGGNPAADSRHLLPQASIGQFFGLYYLTYSFRRTLAADDVALTAQISDDLQTWFSDAGHVLFVSETNHGDGTSTLFFRSGTPWNTKNREFFRLQLQQR
jgi:hypothetical protein